MARAGGEGIGGNVIVAPGDAECKTAARPKLCRRNTWADAPRSGSASPALRCYFFSVTVSANESLWPPFCGWYISSPRAGGSANVPANSVSTTNSAAASFACS